MRRNGGSLQGRTRKTGFYRRLAACARGNSRGCRGIAALEFAIVVPVLLLMMVGLTDLGRAAVMYLQVQSDVWTAVATAYQLYQRSIQDSTNGATQSNSLATMATIAAETLGSSLEGKSVASGSLILNNGPSVSIANGVLSSGGTVANAKSCYCPTGSGTSYAWGAAVTCGSTCAGGSVAAVYVYVSESVTFTPVFSAYHLVPNNTITVTPPIWPLSFTLSSGAS